MGMGVTKPIPTTCASLNKKINKIHNCPSTAKEVLRLFKLDPKYQRVKDQTHLPTNT